MAPAHSDRRGFTVIDLLVTLTVVVLLAAAITVSASHARGDARESVAERNLWQLIGTFHIYALVNQDAMPNPFQSPGPCGRPWYAAGVPSGPCTTFFAFGPDSGFGSMMYAAHWGSLMQPLLPGGKFAEWMVDPRDSALLRRLPHQFRSDLVYDGSYWLSPTVWLKPSYFSSALHTPLLATSGNQWSRNRVSDVRRPADKAVIFERFDFNTRMRQLTSNRVRMGFPQWNNPLATPLCAMVDGSVTPIKIAALERELASPADRNDLEPSGVWNMPGVVLAQYDMASDGLENGASGTLVSKAWIWATRRGILGTDLPRTGR